MNGTSSVSVSTKGQHKKRWNKLFPYLLIFSDRLFFDSVWITFKWVGSQVIFQLLFGMIVALLLNQKFGGRGAVRAMSLVPWGLMT